MFLTSFLTQNKKNNNNVITSKNKQKNTPINSPQTKSNYNIITNTVFTKKSIYYNIKNKIKTTSIYNVITNIQKHYYIVYTLILFASVSKADTYPVDLKILSPITQGALIYGQTDVGTRVFYQDSQLPLTSDGYFVFALPKEAPKEIKLDFWTNNKIFSKTYSVTERTWKEEVVNGLPPKKVSPPPEDLKRIQEENQLLKNARKHSTNDYFPICFTRPVDKKARISSEFGSARILNSVKTAGHSGTDYALPEGSPIYAPADGIVTVTHPDMFYSGKTILIDHGYGIFSSYSHLSEISIKQGDTVKQGDLIGKIGTTGRSTGPHLHLTLTWFGVRIDPEYTLKTHACKQEK